MKSKDKLALLVLSCDAYTEIGNYFFELQNKYMGWFDGNKYFVNETSEFYFPHVRTIHVGESLNWSGKMLASLTQVHEKYVLFMLEDYLIGRPVKEEDIDNAISLMEEHQLRYYKITAIPKIKKRSTIAPYLSAIPSNLRYGINLQAAIFDKDFLAEIVAGEDRSAWKVETDLLNTVTNKFEYNIPGCVLDNRNIVDVHNGVLKGKWFPNTLSYFEKQGIHIEPGTRGILSKKEIMSQNIKRGISHILPTGIARKIKRNLKKVGIKFISDN